MRPGILARLVLFALVFAVLVPLQLASLHLGRGRLAARLPLCFHRAFLRLFSVRVTQSGTPPARGEPALVLANHVSWLDIIALGSLRPLSFVAKSEIAGWPLIGMLARLQRSVFIDRSRRGATARVNRAVGGRLAAGDLIVLFAEGTTGDSRRVLPFRSSLVGAARAALSAEGGELGRVRLQPLALVYTHRGGLPIIRTERPEVAWYGDMALAPHLASFAMGGPIDLHVVWGAPIVFEPGSCRKAATALAEAEVRRSLKRVLAGRVPPIAAPIGAAPTLAAGRRDADPLAPGVAAVRAACDHPAGGAGNVAA